MAAFDRLGRVIADLAMAASGMPPAWVHRTLDDLPVVTPTNSEYGPKFAAAYKDICQQLGVLLATNCPEQVKAFEDSIVGTVLGIRFHTADLSWSISPAKYNKILAHLSGPLLGEPVNLLQMQKIMGFLNDFGQISATKTSEEGSILFREKFWLGMNWWKNVELHCKLKSKLGGIFPSHSPHWLSLLSKVPTKFYEISQRGWTDGYG